MGLFDLFRRKSKEELEHEFRERLIRTGRITDGVIIDNETLESGKIVVFYVYSVQGADFESSEILSDRQASESIKYAPGAHVGVKYDSKHHGSSVLV
jgi:hypothetical protein